MQATDLGPAEADVTLQLITELLGGVNSFVDVNEDMNRPTIKILIARVGDVCLKGANDARIRCEIGVIKCVSQPRPPNVFTHGGRAINLEVGALCSAIGLAGYEEVSVLRLHRGLSAASPLGW